jgi:hypothetical protein
MSSDKFCELHMEFPLGDPDCRPCPHSPDDRGPTLMSIYLNAAQNVTGTIKCCNRVN